MAMGIAAGLAGIGFSSTSSILLLLMGGVGALSVVAPILVAFAADLAGAAERGRVVGTVMSGLLTGVLFARILAGVIAQFWGWQAVFGLAAGAMTVLALALSWGLPFRTPSVKSGYLTLLKSMLALFKEERVLRLRSVYGALAFAIFSALWTPLTFLLSKPPFNYSPGLIGLFGLAGIAGAMASSVAGRLADRGAGARTTFTAIVLLIASWLSIWLGRHSVLPLIAGIVFMDIGVFALQITNQSEIYRLRPDARSRLTSVYMTCFFTGGVFGSSASAFVYDKAGWTGVCALGAGLGFLTVLVWGVQKVRGVEETPNSTTIETCLHGKACDAANSNAA